MNKTHERNCFITFQALCFFVQLSLCVCNFLPSFSRFLFISNPLFFACFTLFFRILPFEVRSLRSTLKLIWHLSTVQKCLLFGCRESKGRIFSQCKSDVRYFTLYLFWWISASDQKNWTQTRQRRTVIARNFACFYIVELCLPTLLFQPSSVRMLLSAMNLKWNRFSRPLAKVMGGDRSRKRNVAVITRICIFLNVVEHNHNHIYEWKCACIFVDSNNNCLCFAYAHLIIQC